MAMYEQLGYCPSSAFFLYEVQSKEKFKHWNETKGILGDRIHYMVYKTGELVHEDLCNVVDALMLAEGDLGVLVATFLETMIPECTYPETGRRIECTDIAYVSQIPWNFIKDGNKWRIVSLNTTSCKDMKLVEDERYLVYIEDTEEAVHLYLYRK